MVGCHGLGRFLEALELSCPRMVSSCTRPFTESNLTTSGGKALEAHPVGLSNRRGSTEECRGTALFPDQRIFPRIRHPDLIQSRHFLVSVIFLPLAFFQWTSHH